MTTFHLFHRLPAELRARIWELTVEPRTVDVRVGRRNNKPCLESSTPVPGPLQTCQEARNHNLYHKAFSEIYPPDVTERRYVWVNLDIDLISIDRTPFDEYELVAPIIQRLQFKGENSDYLFYHFEMNRLRHFFNVKEIHVICADGTEAWHGAMEDHYWPCGEENVFMIDPRDGRTMKGTEMDEKFDQELRDSWAREGYDYDTGLPLDQK